ncbi:ABC transporter substrate-binding protein [Dietzia sp. NCCP-2495]|uniref:MCE family protein n=1 Tax=Dietzia sp. NCCP-2495 TaxID=2934675 RepID=UPI0022307542|nr:MCE family protein [Dietzia sp. NCCP-2495]GLB64775.1 ABC transporter substrate-binding protein [Dietzia sp. NCCP-2495]
MSPKLKALFRGGLLGSFIKLAVFIVVTAMLSTVLAVTIRGGTRDSGTEYSAIFSDVTMLEEGDDVRIAGVVVGHVTSYEIYERDKAKVNFTMSGDRTLPENVHLTLRFRNMIGQRYMNIARVPGEGGTTMPEGTTIPIEQTTPAVDLTALFNGFRPLFTTLQPEDVNALADSLVKVLQGEGGTVTSLVQQTSQLTNHLADRDQVIGEVIDNLTRVLQTVNERDVQFQQLVVTTRQLVEGLSQERDAVGSSIDSMADLTASAENIITATRPQVTESLDHLKKVTDDFVANEPKVSEVLNNMPVNTDNLIRMGSFGSWFQFYLCGADIVSGPGAGVPNLLPSGGPTINHVLYTNAAPRCQAGGI